MTTDVVKDVNKLTKGLEIKADWPTIGVLVSSYCLLKVMRTAIQISKQQK